MTAPIAIGIRAKEICTEGDHIGNAEGYDLDNLYCKCLRLQTFAAVHEVGKDRHEVIT